MRRKNKINRIFNAITLNERWNEVNNSNKIVSTKLKGNNIRFYEEFYCSKYRKIYGRKELFTGIDCKRGKGHVGCCIQYSSWKDRAD